MDTDGELGTTMSGEIVNKPEVCRIAKMQKLPIVAFASWRSCKLSQVFGAILERQHKCVPKDKDKDKEDDYSTIRGSHFFKTALFPSSSKCYFCYILCFFLMKLGSNFPGWLHSASFI